MGGLQYGQRLHLSEGPLKPNFGGTSQMAWHCLTAQLVRYIYRTDVRIYAEMHTSIHQDGFLAIVKYYGRPHLQTG